jgi:hypothetical protein
MEYLRSFQTDFRHREKQKHIIPLPNPFTEVAALRHPTLKPLKPLPNVVNSYVKFKLEPRGNKCSPTSPKPTFDQLYNPISQVRAQPSNKALYQMTLPIPHMLSGSAIKLDTIDRALFNFCKCKRLFHIPLTERNVVLKAMCSGRTLLKETNGWLKELAPMAEQDGMILHALLAFSAGYALDYRPAKSLLHRANQHYRKASELLTERLANTIEMGQEDSVVGALRLMWCDDVRVFFHFLSYFH